MSLNLPNKTSFFLLGFRFICLCCLWVLTSCADNNFNNCLVADLQNYVHLCVPNNELISPRHPGTDNYEIAMKVSPKKLPIIPNSIKFGDASIDLVFTQSLQEEKIRILENHHAIVRKPQLENGMIIMSPPKEEIHFLTQEILFPRDDDQVFFICATPWRDSGNNLHETLCTAETTWKKIGPFQSILLSFPVERKQIDNWKAREILVREYIEGITIKNGGNVKKPGDTE
jgi:hypothetical protein